MLNKNILTLSALASFALVGCLPEDKPKNSDEDPADAFTEVTFDASSYSSWVHVNLESGTSVAESEDWHVALQRYSVNAHDDSELALLAEQADFYENDSAIESVFVNASSASELEHLTADYDLEAATFSAPSISYAMDASGTFYDYNFMNHKLYANNDAVWVVRSSTGKAYAKLRPTMLFDETADSGAGAYENAIFELYIQADGEGAFSNTATTWTVELTNSIGHECFDIDTATEIACDGAEWDIQFQFNPAAYQFVLSLNGGITGSGSAATVSSGHYDLADTAQLTSGIQDAADDDFDITQYHYTSDAQSSVFADNAWYTYNLQGRHGIWPNYRVYAVEKDDKNFLVQFVNYYDSAGTSGHVTLRVIEAD